MKTALAALTILGGMSLLFSASPASAAHHRHHKSHRARHHRSTRSGYYVGGVRHTHPKNDLDKASRSFNHEMVNASKSVNHAAQGKKPTPHGDH